MASANILALLVAWRLALHAWLRDTAVVGRLRQKVLFLGWNSDAEQLAKAFASDLTPGYNVRGYVWPESADPELRDSTALPPLHPGTCTAELLHREGIDVVILSDCTLPKSEIIALSNLCEKEMVQFEIIPSYFEILISGVRLQVSNGVPVLGISQLPLNDFANQLIKRLVDITGAIAGLTLSAPVIAIFGLFIYLESPGPIFYLQRRLGRKGAPFDIIKLRSMRLEAEKDGVGWTTKNDPRRLAIGAFMRKWNIDELPQFWNVLKGEMSLVGPRPERPELIRTFKEVIPHYNARHSIRPGMTGWAQVNGLRGDTDLTERIRYDLYYLEHWNVLFDFKIMARTLMIHKGAC